MPKPKEKHSKSKEKHKIIPALMKLKVPIDALKPAARNARKHNDTDIEAQMLSLTEYGQCKPVVVNSKTGRLEAGHGTWEAAKRLEWTHIAVARAQHTKAQARGYGLADNRIAEISAWEPEALDLELKELKLEGFDLKLTGFGEPGEIPPDNKDINEKDLAKTQNECPKCGFKW